MGKRIPRDYSSAGYRAVTPSDAPERLPATTGDMLDRMEIADVTAMAWRLVPRFWQGPRRTADTNWMIFEDAPGEVWIGERETVVPMEPGDSVFLPPGTRDCELSHVRREWTMLSIHFTAMLPGGLDALRLMGFPIHVHDGSGTLVRIAQDMVREYDLMRPGWKRALVTLAFDAVFYVARYHADRFTERIDDGPALRLMPALALVERELGNVELTVADLARTVGVSAVRLRTLFREAFGATPVEYVRRRRIEQACRLLRHSDQPIKEAIRACGFRDVSFFYRVFRSATGHSPAEWRAGAGT